MSTGMPLQQAQAELQQHSAQSAQQPTDQRAAEFVDSRPQATAQRRLQEIAHISAQAKQLQAYNRMVQNGPHAIQLKAMQAMMNDNARQRVEDEESVQGKFEPAQRVEDEEPLQAKLASEHTAQLVEKAAVQPNNTGLPHHLKSGVESLSGMSLDHVKVHYNSDKPAQLNAHAYAQGREIHVAPGQEQHLPHEAWHIVQQAQGRVKPTIQMKAGVPVNDDVGLESEADLMGAKALGVGQMVKAANTGMLAMSPLADMASQRSLVVTQRAWVAEESEAGAVHSWDVLMDGVKWFANEASGMWYRVVGESSMDYSGDEGVVRPFEAWHQLRLQTDPTHQLPFIEYERISASDEDNAVIMNQIVGEAASYAVSLGRLKEDPDTLAASCMNIMEVLNDKARKLMDGKAAKLREGRAKLVADLIKKTIVALSKAENRDGQISVLGDFFGGNIAQQNFTESNNRGTYIMMVLLGGIYGVPIPSPDMALSREKIGFNPKKIKDQFLGMYKK